MKGVFPLFALCAVAVLSRPAAAQMGLPGAMHGRMTGPTRDSGVVMPRLANPLNLMIAHRQDLALSDSQFVHIIALKRALDSTNAPLLRKADSVARLFRSRPIFAKQSAAHQDSVRAGREVVRAVADAVRDNDETYRERAYALLAPEQVRTAGAIEAEAGKAP